jgi:futalosine hydrolase
LGRRGRFAGRNVRFVILVVAATERELAGVNGAASLACGIGPVEAALATSRALASLGPDAVLHIGIALGSESVYCDIVDPNARIPRVERELPDPDLLEAARRALPRAHVLPIATCASVGGGTLCEVEGMEGFGVLRAAAVAGVPAVELRAISNAVDETDRSRWRVEDALAALTDATTRVLAELA